ncbi:hypothetical protein BCT69_13375 [Enterovibrio norvegicus]|nr:hypothetical protein BCT69_13375 [Enterovibrio norvegicus]
MNNQASDLGYPNGRAGSVPLKETPVLILGQLSFPLKTSKPRKTLSKTLKHTFLVQNTDG